MAKIGKKCNYEKPRGNTLMIYSPSKAQYFILT